MVWWEPICKPRAVREDLWVARLSVSTRTANKIAARHRITESEVRDAVVCVAGLEYVWDDDSDRGVRAIVQVKIRDQSTLVVLYPAGDPLGDSYHPGSAYFADL